MIFFDEKKITNYKSVANIVNQQLNEWVFFFGFKYIFGQTKVYKFCPEGKKNICQNCEPLILKLIDFFQRDFLFFTNVNATEVN